MPIRLLFCLIFTFPIVVLGASSTDTLGNTSLLYNGTEYIKQFDQTKGTPFFPTEKTNGSVFYFGNWYQNLDLLYDIQDDIVITRDIQGLLKMRLTREKLDEFMVDGHHFVKIKLTTPAGEFYEQFYKGQRSLLMQWRKVTDSEDPQNQKFILRKTLFVLDKGEIIPLDKTSDLFSIDPKHLKELKKIYREQKISFKKDPINASKAIIHEIEQKGW
ncbi:MAG: hypothetical protein RL253_284 [Bacteroidota bacterium]|jgi:hypothetical protein